MNNKFLYLEQFLTALEDLEPEDRYRATYVLCYYGLYREFPQDATAIDKMYVKTNMKLFEGQDNFIQGQREKASKGGKPPVLTDEQILGAYKALLEENGGVEPSEQDVINRCGGGVSRIVTRNVWKNRKELLYESMKQVSYNDTNHTDNHTNVSNMYDTESYNGFHGF